jgi:hypothetical protein
MMQAAIGYLSHIGKSRTPAAAWDGGAELSSLAHSLMKSCAELQPEAINDGSAVRPRNEGL